MKKVLIIQSIFYEKIAKFLLDGATAKLKEQNVQFEIITVPGAFEVPAAIAMANKTKKYAGYVALGCVIRGETTHYDYVCQESARGLNDLAIQKKLAIGNGILTVENEEQAIKRSDPNQKNKGGFAANACIEMIRLKESFGIDKNKFFKKP
ncbi:MAG: 6,7-dimethyl-8-ribityllumazine synthase [Rickettsiales bacterium]|nr:6,7-dimethyl-8-ribityllumazine synthase [Rickettsiales bacterium]